MPSLTLPQQRAIIKKVPKYKVNEIKKVCYHSTQQGEGFKDILKKARSILGPIASEIGPVVMRELIMPMLMKKLGLKGEGKKKRKNAIKLVKIKVYE